LRLYKVGVNARYFNNTLISLVLTFSDKSFIYLVVIERTL